MQEFINKTRLAKIIAVNIFFCLEKPKAGPFVNHLEILRLPLVARVPHTGNHCFKLTISCTGIGRKY